MVNILKRLALIDHYDSFTHNIRAWLQGIPPYPAVDIIPYDDVQALQTLRRAPCPVVLSAGPRSPTEASATCELVADLTGIVPIFGVCLGMQIICTVLGLEIKRARYPLHGRQRKIFRTIEHGALAGLPQTFLAAAYNSLAVAPPPSLPKGWLVTAISSEGEVQAIERLSLPPVCGVQFHPESFLDECAGQVLGRSRCML